MFEPFSLLTSALYVVQGMLGLTEQRIYTGDQRSRAPLVSRIHLVVSVLFTVTGVASMLWVRRNGLPTTWYPTILSCGLLGAILVQRWMYRSMGVSRSPLIDRVTSRLR